MAKLKKGYKSQIDIAFHEGEELKEWEVVKIVNGIDRETKRERFWRTLAAILLLAFALLAVCILSGYIPANVFVSSFFLMTRFSNRLLEEQDEQHKEQRRRRRKFAYVVIGSLLALLITLCIVFVFSTDGWKVLP